MSAPAARVAIGPTDEPSHISNDTMLHREIARQVDLIIANRDEFGDDADRDDDEPNRH